MWIPEQFDPSANYSLRHTDHVAALPHDRVGLVSELREWSSIIGIVTAIVGNVLISFALNIQRYAHIRIDREHHESHTPSSRGSRKSSKGNRAYGAARQEQIAEERAKINANAPGPGNAHGDGTRQSKDMNKYRDQDEHERSPLLKSYDSGSTLTTLEKRSENGEERKSYLKSPYWWAGIILMTIGEAGNFLAYGFAPASIVSPLGVVALVSNCIIAPFMLKERFRMRDGWGVLVAIAGAVTVVLSAKNSETKLGQDELWGAISRWEFLTYVGITAGVIIALMIASPRYGDRTILIDLGLVGLFGGYTALSTKGVASLLSDTLWMALTFPITYFLVAILIFSALMQIRYVNRALQRFDSTQVIPIQFVLFTLSVIIGSAVLYRDFESTTAARAAKFVGGCLLTFLGVYLITSGRPQDSDEEEGEEGTDEEEGIHLVDDEADYDDQSLSRQETRDSNVSPRRISTRPRTPDRTYSDSGTATTSSQPQTPYTPSPFTFPSTTNPNALRTSDERDENWFTYPTHSERTPISPDQPSPFTRAQSGPPQTAIFTRLRPTQSHQQQTPTTPTTPRLYLRSPSTPTATATDPHRTPTATAALRAHLSPSDSPSPGTPGPAVPTTGYPHPYPPLNRATRGSFGRLLPGPLLSPLSSSLSAVVAESLRRGEGTGSVGRARGRLSGIRRKSSKRPAVVGMASDGVVPVAKGLSRGLDEDGMGLEGGAEADNEIREVVSGEGSTEVKKGKLQAMSESLSDLVERRRTKKSESPGTSSEGSPASKARRRDEENPGAETAR